MNPSCCQITDSAFTEAEARSEMRNYRRKGPPENTRLILEGIRSLGLRDASLLDIGGGIGAIHHELLQDVAASATHVDASTAYLTQARAETERRGHTERVRFMHADFTQVAQEVPEADIVTLDRVVCCYPDYRGLLGAAAAHGRRAIALSYPRDLWYLRLFMKVQNFIQSLRRDPFRVFVHPVDAMHEILSGAGFKRASLRRLWVWEVALYQK